MPGTKNITKFIPGAIAENVFKYLYESIDPYKGYQYFENRVIDGKKYTYNHIIFELHPPKNNHFELVAVSTIEPKKDDKHQIRHFDMPAIVLSVDVLQFPDKAFVKIIHSPFFEEIANNLLSHFADSEKETMLPPIYSDRLKAVKELSEIPLPIDNIALRLAISTSTVKRYRKILGIRRRKK